MLDSRYDVIVVGSGPAGLSAALYADRNGARTLLIEKSGFVGGMSTDGMLNIFCGRASGELFREIADKLEIQRGTRRIYDTEELKQFYYEKLSHSGVKLLLHSVFSDAHSQDGKIQSIEVVTSSGKRRLEADYFIDASGDGVLAAAAGAEYGTGREADGKMQPCTLLMRLGGVDDSRAIYPTFGTHKEYQELIQRAVEAGEIPRPAGHLIIIQEKNPGMAQCNMTNCISVDGSDAEQRTHAEMLCRSQVQPLLHFLNKHVPGYEKAYILQTGYYAGVRETRHFKGDYIMDENDILENRIFDDWCATGLKYGFGIHNMSGSGSDPTNTKTRGAYTLPFRSLLPVKFTNLLLAGRCISGTHLAHSSYRVMPICMAMGQAAGTAAALAKAQGATSIRDISIARLQKALVEQGMEDPSI